MTINTKVYPFPLLLLSLTFVLFTAIGTLSHELGHIVVAKALGYQTELHYSSMNFNRTVIRTELKKLTDGHEYEIRHHLPYPQKAAVIRLFKKLHQDNLLVRIGGPLQTMLTGTLGLLMLYLRKSRFKDFRLIDWLWVFLALFWLRQACNLFLSVLHHILRGHGKWFGGDERRISLLLHLPAGTISIITGILGLAVSIYAIFRIIPLEKRFTFILSGLIGGSLGFILWMHVAGPVILP